MGGDGGVPGRKKTTLLGFRVGAVLFEIIYCYCRQGYLGFFRREQASFRETASWENSSLLSFSRSHWVRAASWFRAAVEAAMSEEKMEGTRPATVLPSNRLAFRSQAPSCTVGRLSLNKVNRQCYVVVW